MITKAHRRKEANIVAETLALYTIDESICPKCKGEKDFIGTSMAPNIGKSVNVSNDNRSRKNCWSCSVQQEYQKDI